MKKYILFMFLSLFAFPEQVYAEFDCEGGRPGCEDLGYVHSSSDCSGGNILRCPFDDTKLFCNKYPYEKCDASSNSNSYLKYAKQCVTSCDRSEHGSCDLIAFTSSVSTGKCQVILKNMMSNNTYSPTTTIDNNTLTFNTSCSSTSKLKSGFLSDVTASNIVNLTPGQVLHLYANQYFTSTDTSSGHYVYARYDNDGDGTVDSDDHYFFNLNTGLFDELTLAEIPGKRFYIPCRATVDCETDKDYNVPTLLKTVSCGIGSFNYGNASDTADADGVYCYGTENDLQILTLPVVVNGAGRGVSYSTKFDYHMGIVDIYNRAKSYAGFLYISELSGKDDPCESEGTSAKERYRLLTKKEMDVVVKKKYDLAGGGSVGEAAVLGMGDYYLVLDDYTATGGTIQCYNISKAAMSVSQIDASRYGTLPSDCSDTSNISLHFSYYCVGDLKIIAIDPGLR